MNLNLYDIFSKLIPGGLIYGCLHYCGLFSNLKTKSELVVGILIFVIGYFIDAIASGLERNLIYKTFGGNPSTILLEGGCFGRIRLYRIDDLNNYFQSCTSLDIINNYSDKEYLFGIIYSKISKKDYKRVNDFLAMYSFSRNIFISLIICFIVVVFFLNDVYLSSIIFVLTLISWWRCKQRNYYFTKEVIQVFIDDVVPIT